VSRDNQRALRWVATLVLALILFASYGGFH
jgi:hypothetical protein